MDNLGDRMKRYEAVTQNILMKRMFFIAGVGLVGLFGCHQKTKMETNPVPVTKSHGKEIRITDLASNKDLVCGMILEGQSIADTASYEGNVYGFCALECKEEFLKNPQTYIAQQ